jgi:hypothetical protein
MPLCTPSTTIKKKMFFKENKNKKVYGCSQQKFYKRTQQMNQYS